MNLAGRFQIAFLVLILLAGIQRAGAQQSGQGGGTENTPTPPTKEAPKPIAPVAQPPTQQPDLRRPQQLPSPMIFITGMVVLDNGEPPPMGTVIERECGGLVKKEAVVDLAGSFGFQIGGIQKSGLILPDASQGLMDDVFGYSADGSSLEYGYGFGPLGVFSRLSGCELRAQLQGYQSSTVRLEERRFAGPVDVGTIVLFPIGKVQGKLVSATSLLAPKAAKKSLARAEKAFRKEKLDEAERLLRSAVESYPKYVEAWFALGRVHQQQGRQDEARGAFGKAIAADGLFVESYVRLAQIAAVEQKWEEAADLSNKAISLDPATFPEAYFLSGLASYNLNNLDLAEKRARQAARLDRQHRIPRIHLLIAAILAQRNDKAGAMAEMRNYLKFAPKAEDADAVRARLERMKSDP